MKGGEAVTQVRAQVLVRFLTADEGGRSGQARSDSRYIVLLRTGLVSDEGLPVACSCLVEVPAGESIMPGETKMRWLRVAYVPELDKLLLPDSRVILSEGAKVVAEGRVVTVQ